MSDWQYVEMPRDRVTDKEGRWYLRQGYVDDKDEIHVALVSVKAPVGTLASDLVPETVEISLEDDLVNDDIILPVDVVRELIEWP